MNTAEYVRNVLRTRSTKVPHFPNQESIDLFHAIIGIGTEAGELLDVIKKDVFQGKPIDRTNLKEEFGDLMWYVALGCHAFGFSLEDVMASNIKKLQTRYPEKFSEEASAKRDLEAERKALED